MEKEKALIQIKGNVVDTEEDESVELETDAEVYKEDGFTVLSYNETDVFGMEGTVCVIKLSPDFVSVTRLGTINSLMEFQVGEKNVTLYSTPYGELALTLVTNKIDIEYEGDKLKSAQIDYSIEISGLTNAHNTLSIKVIKYN